MEEAALNLLVELEQDLKKCRGQSYNNDSNMSVMYSSLQSRIRGKNVFAEFVPCAAHILNLVVLMRKKRALKLFYSFLLYKDFTVFFRHILIDEMY
ncbi:hypothetical protein TNCT_158671 [Trichonephila clavata]|uniref:Uncharacterized protein n=1 Tax=Trichonephila clavata TaxID=2740835 RepID=A0A8X6F7D6_TRICU|nr:hypothetical protein TNCT_158671 [Trichonephila clavata]